MLPRICRAATASSLLRRRLFSTPATLPSTGLVECVPNFSEGRDEKVIAALASALEAVEGCTMLDVDPGKSTNRTVYTFVGTPEAAVEGALARRGLPTR